MTKTVREALERRIKTFEIELRIQPRIDGDRDQLGFFETMLPDIDEEEFFRAYPQLKS